MKSSGCLERNDAIYLPRGARELGYRIVPGTSNSLQCKCGHMHASAVDDVESRTALSPVMSCNMVITNFEGLSSYGTQC